MKITIIRHFPTAGNLKKQYIGWKDESIIKIVDKFDYSEFLSEKNIFVSPLTRAIETADILFSAAEKTIVEDLKEMNFGIFEGKSYEELKKNTLYSNWLESNCEGKCPEGESKDEFCNRTERAIKGIMLLCADKGQDSAVIVAHGGTVMAVAERMIKPSISYFSLQLDFGEYISFEL